MLNEIKSVRRFRSIIGEHFTSFRDRISDRSGKNARRRDPVDTAITMRRIRAARNCVRAVCYLPATERFINCTGSTGSWRDANVFACHDRCTFAERARLGGKWRTTPGGRAFAACARRTTPVEPIERRLHDARAAQPDSTLD
ncbi:hypothetical protein [Burkholderia oklahomensis]|uniref:hypothetical protein n=1 Tax=Burkholderia oklahomensis TaxID=342113 RepID=UPI0012F47BE0|nr:hypothetical protein [Burkholderia oklahomensis]MBI0363603.1 hypothetical protein [Burkholderia oklahomensis]